MIKINLLPTGFKKKEETDKSVSRPPSKLPMFAIMAVGFLFVLATHIILGLLTFDKKMQVSSLEKRSRDMQAQSKEIEDIKKDITTKKDKVKIMETILKKDLYLAHFLNEINKAVPKGLWLTRLSFSSKGLVIEGSVFSFDSDEVSLVNSFFDELKSDNFSVQSFADFNMDSVQRRNIKEYEIIDFLLTAERKQENETQKRLSHEIGSKRKR